MISRTLFLSLLLVLAVAGLIAAGANYHRPKKRVETSSEREMPPAAAEYARIMGQYRGVDSAMDIAGTIRIYDGDKNNQLKETRGFRCYHYREEYFWQLSYLQTFCNGEIVVQLDTVDKVITLSKAMTRDAANRATAAMQPALLFSDSANFRLTGTVAPAGDGRQLTLHSPIRPDIREYRLFYDTIGYRLQRAEIEWWKGGRSPQEPGTGKIWLAKMDYDQGRRARPDIRREIASIVQFQKGEAVPTPRYRDYKINSNW